MGLHLQALFFAAYYFFTFDLTFNLIISQSHNYNQLKPLYYV